MLYRLQSAGRSTDCRFTVPLCEHLIKHIINSVVICVAEFVNNLRVSTFRWLTIHSESGWKKLINTSSLLYVIASAHCLHSSPLRLIGPTVERSWITGASTFFLLSFTVRCNIAHQCWKGHFSYKPIRYIRVAAADWDCFFLFYFISPLDWSKRNTVAQENIFGLILHSLLWAVQLEWWQYCCNMWLNVFHWRPVNLRR